MSEINAIATNNFILHNIDAKKLYVQEPLFTANSGDAVYVGWRPDETVLWEGTGTSAGTLSENPYNFDRIGVYWIMNNDGTLQSPTYQEFYTKEDSPYYLDVGFGNSYAYIGKVSFTMNSTGFSATKAQGIQIPAWNATAASIATIDTTYLSKMRNGFTKVVGINRKENA